MTNDSIAATIELYGPFRLLIGEDEVWISSRKARAMLALLAMSPYGARTRAWLTDRLWGSRAEEQGRASLRRELSTLRALHPVLAELVSVRGDRVVLDLKQCLVDAHAPAPAGLGPSSFLEGFDLPGEESFEDWLREVRQHLAGMQPPRQTGPSAVQAAGSVLPVQRVRLCVGLMPPENLQTCAASAMLGHDLLDAAGHELSNRGGLDLFDFRDVGAGHVGGDCSTPGPDANLILRVRVIAEGQFQVSARLVMAGSRNLIWSRQSVIDMSRADKGAVQFAIFVNELAEEVQFALAAQTDLDSGRHMAVCHATAGVHQVFGLQPGSVDAAEARFAEAHRLSGDPVYLAWLAYLGTFKVDPQFGITHIREAADACADLAGRALAGAPFNTQCLALLIHVFGFALRDPERAAGLIEQAKALGARNLMFYDSLALFHIYANRPDMAREPARIAAEMGRFLPYRYAFETTLAMIDTLEGRYAEGVNRGRAALATSPGSGAKPFGPTLRFLTAAHCQLGDHDAASGYLLQLRAQEPELQGELVDDPHYPMPSESARSLFKAAMRTLAV